MSLEKQKLAEALNHLQEARRAMAWIGAGSGDWMTKMNLAFAFNDCTRACKDYARCMAGIGVRRNRKKAKR